MVIRPGTGQKYDADGRAACRDRKCRRSGGAEWPSGHGVMARRRYLRPILFRCGNLCLPLGKLMLIPPTGTVRQDARPETLNGLPAAYPIARRNTDTHMTSGTSVRLT